MLAPGQLQQFGNNMGLQQSDSSENDDLLTQTSSVTLESLESLLVPRLTERLVPIMEDSFRKVVKEGLEQLEKNLMDKLQSNHNRQGSTSETRSLQLKFLEKISSSVLTSSKIKGEAGTAIHLALIDSLTGDVVKTGPEAAAKVQILVLDGDNGGGNLEEFNNRIVNEMKGKKSILRGTSSLNLQEGISSIDDLSFTQNSNWVRNRKLCLGARALCSFSGTTIEPATTESFILKDHRSTSYAKKEIPALLDELWRLKHIDKDGARIKRLKDENIQNVKDFLVLLNKDPQKLRKILNIGSKTWEEIIDHARTCIIDAEEVYLYFDPTSQQKNGVVFDVVGQLKGLLEQSQYFPISTLSDQEKKNAHKLVVCAYDSWVDVRQYNDETSLREHFACTSEATRQQSPGQPNSFGSVFCSMYDCILPGTASHGISESSPLGAPEEGFYCQVYSPDSMLPLPDEFVKFKNPSDPPEMLNPELETKITWTYVICVLKWFMIRKRVGSSDGDHINKKLKIMLE